MHIGQITAIYRKECLHLTQYEVSKIVGCSVPNISRFEHGINNSFSLLLFYLDTGFGLWYDRYRNSQFHNKEEIKNENK